MNYKDIYLGIPHDAVILTNNDWHEFSASKISPLLNNQTHSPYEIEIHLTGNCSLRCKGCSYATRRNTSQLSIIEIEQIFSSAKKMNVNTIFYSGGGDPLSWHYWEQLILLKDKYIPQVKSGISTNLYFQDKDFFSIDFFDFLQIHLVGYDEESCKNNTGVNCFNQILKNLETIHSARKNVTIKVLITRNFHTTDITRYLDFLSKYSFQTIVLKFEQDFLGDNSWDTSALRTQLLNLLMSHPITNNYVNLFSTFYDIYTRPQRCYIAESNLYCLIDEKGLVYPCVAATNNPMCTIGCIKNETLFSIYNKKHFNTKIYSDNMLTKTCPIQACRHYKYNSFIESYNDDSFVSERPELI